MKGKSEMKLSSQLHVREIEANDIEYLLDYWFNSDARYLEKMGADIEKLPARSEFRKMLEDQLNTPFTTKKAYALIWELYGTLIGHSNVNNISYGKEATMHLHLWNSENRTKGIGTALLRKSIFFYFNNLKIKKLICEPYALNPAPNKTLEKVGFHFIKKYRTTPGTINFEQEVNRWELTKEKYNTIWAK